jgi:hypothetical protein
MGTAKKTSQVKLFLAVMYTSKDLYHEVIDFCTGTFGQVDRSFGPVELGNFTDYYSSEMGTGILKQYHTFEKLIERDALASIKTATNALESKLSSHGRRRVNLDPGYLTHDKLVLATTKDFYHRIYLSEGIFAEVTLHFRQGRYRFFSWTYPDYQECGVLDLCEKARADLVGTLRKENRSHT